MSLFSNMMDFRASVLYIAYSLGRKEKKKRYLFIFNTFFPKRKNTILTLFNPFVDLFQGYYMLSIIFNQLLLNRYLF